MAEGYGDAEIGSLIGSVKNFDPQSPGRHRAAAPE